LFSSFRLCYSGGGVIIYNQYKSTFNGVIIVSFKNKKLNLKSTPSLSIALNSLLQSKIFNLKSTQKAFTILRLRSGFTIVELLVVIVVIGILATITAVAYTGVSQKAIEAALQVDLANASKTLKVYQATHDSYPTALDEDNCPTAPVADANLCLKASSGNTFAYIPDPTGDTFGLEVTNTNSGTVYSITDSSSYQVGALPIPTLADTDPDNWIQIGTQVWAKYNLNEGTRIASTINQTNNPGGNIVEKYCYGNTEAGCTDTDSNGIPYGGLYQWDEAMGYEPTPTSPDDVVQGICPDGSHIPSDDEWKTLELYLGMAPGSAAGQVDATGWRGTDEGTQLKSGGTSGLNLPLAGFRYTNGSFSFRSSDVSLLSSSDSGGSAWRRYLGLSYATVDRSTNAKAVGFSVRCVGN
jgi:uncharacterized protein (TIGR02145 family)/prepilin-type N-terminal cleavage/methylation domain-containing protein